MQYILFFVALFGALCTAGAIVVGVLLFAHFNPDQKWVRTLIYWVLFLIGWAFMNSI